jgi:hypothetical protein
MTFNSRQYKKLKDHFGDEPFLVHHTNYKFSPEKIISSGYIIPSIQTKNNNYYGTNLRHTYFSISNASLIHHIDEQTFILSADFLINTEFYLNKEWRGNPTGDKILIKTRIELNNFLNKCLEIFIIKPHLKHKHQQEFEILIDGKVSTNNIIGVILNIDYSLDYIETKINNANKELELYNKKLKIYNKRLKQNKIDNNITNIELYETKKVYVKKRITQIEKSLNQLYIYKRNCISDINYYSNKNITIIYHIDYRKM